MDDGDGGEDGVGGDVGRDIGCMDGGRDVGVGTVIEM